MGKNQVFFCLAIILPGIALAQVTEEWVARYNGPGNDYDVATSLAVDDAGNVYVTGYSYGSGTFEDYATVKYSSTGVQQWAARYNGPGNGDDIATSLAVDDAGNVYVTGYSYGSGTDLDYATVKYSQGPGVEEVLEPSLIMVSATLNRLSWSVTGDLPGQAQLNLYSADGRKVLEETVEGQGIWEAPVTLSQGVYFARIHSGEVYHTAKLVIVR